VIWERGGVRRLTAIVSATFGFVHGGPARLLAPRPIGPDDEAPHLPGAGVVLSGHAIAPGGRPTARALARLALVRNGARLDKTIHVVGDRTQEGGAPLPFVQMPLVWERAFGGRNHPDNPAGTSAPNLIDPRDPRRPAGFGPLSGAAPTDQQLDALEGDEWIVLDGMDPSLSRLATRLPSARAVARWVDLTGSARPLELRADTLAIDADRRRCSMVWRGSIPLDDAAGNGRIEAAIVTATLAPPWPVVAAHRAKPTLVDVHPPSDDDEHTSTVDLGGADARPLAPFAITEPTDATSGHAPLPGAPWSTPAAPPPALSPDGDGPTVSLTSDLDLTPAKEPERPVASIAITADLPALSPDGDGPTLSLSSALKILFAPGPEARARPVAPFPIAQPTDAAPAHTAPLPGAPWSTPAARLPALSPEGDGLTFSLSSALELPQAPEPEAPRVHEPQVSRVHEPESTPEPVPPLAPIAIVAAPLEPTPDAERAPLPPPSPSDSARARLLAAVAAGEPLRGLDLKNAELRGIDLTGVSLDGCKLAGADLGGATLSGARLTDADLSGANLAGAVLTGADLSRADLSRAHGEGADLRGARGTRPKFAGGTWDGADFERLDATGADFSESSLANARFDDATLIDVSLEGARGAVASFRGARMSGVRAETASFVRASFERAEAPDSTWDGATLDAASFEGARLSGSSFERASCARTRFASANLEKVNFQRIGGEDADFARAVLEGADLRFARLVGANLDAANLRGVLASKADLTRARIAGADLGGANLRSSKLVAASLAGAKLDATDLRDADLERCDMTGSLRKTAKLQGANLKDVIGADDD
jgi:uncharacterized protein YjbI with pentapeptide repeats